MSLTFTYNNHHYHIDANASGSTIPIINHVSIKKVIKKSLFAYMIFAREIEGGNYSNAMIAQNAQNMSSQEHMRKTFLMNYGDCFVDSLSGMLPPIRPEDHRIDLIPGSSPPNLSLIVLAQANTRRS